MLTSIRQRLIGVAALAALACAAALFSINHLVHSGREQRLERARDEVRADVEYIRDNAGVAPVELMRRRTTREGAQLEQLGVLDETLEPTKYTRRPGPLVRAAVEEAVRSLVPGTGLSIREVDRPEAVVVIGVARIPAGGYAWGLIRVPVPKPWEAWRLGVLVLAFASLGLVFASVNTLVTFQSGTNALTRSIGALARDLGAPVERPSLRELRRVSDGIVELAAKLSVANRRHEQLTQQLAQRERLASLGRVAAGVAHEVRNPLASIKLRVDLAQRSPDAPPALAHDLADISDEVARLDRLVADLLTVARRRTGPLVEADVGALVRKRVELLAPWALERQVCFDVKGSARADIDAGSLARALDNLLRNAVDASSPDHVVSVAVEPSARDVTINVCDEGPGVPAERVAELFEPFFTTKAGGTGLGLALSRAIAESHRGSLSYHREAGVTRFALVIPTEAPVEPTSGESSWQA